jgi:hypothetical protein
MKRSTFEQFDLVKITTTKRVKWMMDVPGNSPDPNGIWSIICLYPKNGLLLIQKDTALARIPASDVVKVANYDIENVFDKLKKTGKKYLNQDKE